MEYQENKPKSPTKSIPDSDFFNQHFQEPVMDTVIPAAESMQSAMDTNTPAAESTESATDTSIPAVVSAEPTMDTSSLPVVSADSATDTSIPALESTETAAEMQCEHDMYAFCSLPGCKSIHVDASKPVTPTAIKPVDASTTSKSSTISSPQMQCEHGPDSTCLRIGCKSFPTNASKPAMAIKVEPMDDTFKPLTDPYAKARESKAPRADARKMKKSAGVKRERPDLEDDLDSEPAPYNPKPTPSGLNTRDPNAPKRQKRAADATAADSSVAAEETGGDQGNNKFLLLEGNDVIKGGKRMLLKLVEFPDLGIDKKKGLTKQAAVSKKKYNNQYTAFKDTDLPHPDATYDSRATVLCLAAAYDGEVGYGRSQLRGLKNNFTVRDDPKADVPGGQAAFIEYPD
ncbi:hypothetical protein LTR56_016779 [Elasticomyces elasticus]|nr:hypothetical protein LTR22_021782 [Elasticomyces elasticus]KAK3631546.1 hypothetical protein LTR56_016779 [Elasticomyces elasticus]KAK4903045.1 hypothetical protein LTR49_026903 [Elasticomyces elasticus]KAK5737307.1 hypothetical protein LTS12_025922 [Elasticomyces elasticus]